MYAKDWPERTSRQTDPRPAPPRLDRNCLTGVCRSRPFGKETAWRPISRSASRTVRAAWPASARRSARLGINIEGLLGIGFEGRGIIHVCVQDGAGARKALEGAGIKVEGEADAILGPPVQGAETPGTMGMMARQIADAGINVRAVYMATGSRVVMVTDDNAKLMELMKNM